MRMPLREECAVNSVFRNRASLVFKDESYNETHTIFGKFLDDQNISVTLSSHQFVKEISPFNFVPLNEGTRESDV